MELIKTFPKGSTVMLMHQEFDSKKYRTCSPSGGLCTYDSCIDRALELAQVYDDYYSYKPAKTLDESINF